MEKERNMIGTRTAENDEKKDDSLEIVMKGIRRGLKKKAGKRLKGMDKGNERRRDGEERGGEEGREGTGRKEKRKIR